MNVKRWAVMPAGLLLMASLSLSQLQPPSVQAGAETDAIAIRVTRFGPWPTSITHGSEPFLLFIANRSGILDDTYSLVLKPLASSSTAPAAAATSLLDLHSTQTRQRDHQFIQLLPGNYQIHFQSHPDWLVSITITTNQ